MKVYKAERAKNKGRKLFLSSWCWMILAAFLLQIYNLTSCSLPCWQDQTWNETVNDIVSSCLSGHSLTAMLENTQLGISKPGNCCKRRSIKEEMKRKKWVSLHLVDFFFFFKCISRNQNTDLMLSWWISRDSIHNCHDNKTYLGPVILCYKLMSLAKYFKGTIPFCLVFPRVTLF